ncbi:MAG: EF-P beta-lysylation protein EpmB [Oleibacter sp.]|nr:EF-P beta-lysylation protein EpmB [Thalassolituus sp.]
MRIIHRTDPTVEMLDWQQYLVSALRTLEDLLNYVDIDPTMPAAAQLLVDQASRDFPLLVPKPFADLIEKGNINDPLLRQVLPSGEETLAVSGYVKDPLAEKHSNITKGIIHKYQGRVLLLVTGGCAVNCRYCFRRHFDYSDNKIKQREWQEALQYVRDRPDIKEVILSGGDPLMLNDESLFALISTIEAIPHVSRLRIHTRLPVVIPQRLTTLLTNRLNSSRLHCSMVLHINHANELSPMHKSPLAELRSGGTWLLNQSVLLAGINDDVETLVELSEALFINGISPYYLHQLDAVAGAHHFQVDPALAQNLYLGLREQLPGYLVPLLVKEIANTPYKTPLV